MQAFLSSAAADSHYGMLWITCDVDHARHKAILDHLADSVPAARAKGKKVVIFGVKTGHWR